LQAIAQGIEAAKTTIKATIFFINLLKNIPHHNNLK
jgi:hypothetical protein